MQYTKFFSAVLRDHGSLNFEPDQLKLIMNLIHLEGKREGLLQVQERFKKTDPPNRYDLLIKAVTDQINVITNGFTPNLLLQKWKHEND
ncbi:MAG: hypothetical protein EP305_05550 [Bacteroidetes bacterium]|nr:MAG: hypothetical protein EP305_05550 [Bacteroidota bacterium]